MQLQWLRRIHRCQTIRLLELPTINETVVTRRTLQIDAQESLAHALSELHRHGLARADIATPLDAFGKTLAFGRGSDQPSGKFVVWLVVHQRPIQPIADLFASAVDVSGAGIVIPQQIIPESQPMLGVGNVIGQQGPNESSPLVARLVLEKTIQNRCRRQESYQVEMNATNECGVVDRR